MILSGIDKYWRGKPMTWIAVYKAVAAASEMAKKQQFLGLSEGFETVLDNSS